MMDPDKDTAEQQNFFFGGIDGCKFRRPVVPGDTLVSIDCTLGDFVVLHCPTTVCY